MPEKSDKPGKRAEILPPPSLLSKAMDLGRVQRLTAEESAFAMQMPNDLKDEFKKRVEEK